jgi:formylglycine-generating enzyme required for sulfatase activity
LVGKTLTGKYAVEAVVDEGGSSVVYRARHLVWNRPVAVKAFKTGSDLLSSEAQDALLRGFIQEGAILAELSERSAAICQARDVATVTTARGDWVPFMVLEWLEGQSLEAVMQRERDHALPARTLSQAVRLLDPVAQALSLAHERGIVHRDMKPGNVFVLGDARSESCPIKLLDFGIAKRCAHDSHTTGAGPKSFTPSYGAPEQFWPCFGPTSPATDVFALALVLVELVSGKDALIGDDVEDLAQQVIDRVRRPTPRARGAKVTDEVEAIFSRALSVMPRERYRSVIEMWTALRDTTGVPASWQPPSDPDPETPTVRLSRARTPVGGVAVRAVAATLPSARPRRRIAWRGAMAMVIIAAAVGLYAESPRLLRVARAGAHAAPAVASNTPALAGGPEPQVETQAQAQPQAPAQAQAQAPAQAQGEAQAQASAQAPQMSSASQRQPLPVADTQAKTEPSSTPVPPACPAGMVFVPSGHFFMGTDDGPEATRPAHPVKLTAFCIDRYEVTIADYKSCSDTGACKRAAEENSWPGIEQRERDNYDPLCNAREPASRARHPVNCIDWGMAEDYCTSLGARLPTEAEWELAARGPDGRPYPWGDAPPGPTLLNACGRECVAWGLIHDATLPALFLGTDGAAITAPVGSYPAGASPYGMEDAAGNVWEWVADRYARYDGTGETLDRVIRGGAWNSTTATWVSATFRFATPGDTKSYGIGFRCAK